MSKITDYERKATCKELGVYLPGVKTSGDSMILLDRLIEARRSAAECARIAAAESQYWQAIEKEEFRDISIGAMGAAANICAAIVKGRTLRQFKVDLKSRGKVRKETAATV